MPHLKGHRVWRDPDDRTNHTNPCSLGGAATRPRAAAGPGRARKEGTQSEAGCPLTHRGRPLRRRRRSLRQTAVGEVGRPAS